MSRNSKVASIAFTGAAAMLTAGLTVTPGKAATSHWHFKNNNVLYGGPFKGKNDGTAVLKDTTTGVTVGCKVVDPLGNVLKSVPVVPQSPKVGSITGASARSCTIGGTIPLTVRPNRVIDLHAVTYNTATGVTAGFLGTKGNASALSATLTGVGNNCKATVTGSILPLSYHNASHRLFINPAHTVTIKVKAATSCGLLRTGDKVYLNCVNTITTPSRLTLSRG